VIRYGELAKILTGWRADPLTAWLSETPIHPQQQALMDLDLAYKNYFKVGRISLGSRVRARATRFVALINSSLTKPGRVFLPKVSG
jgi:hypothetical protein